MTRLYYSSDTGETDYADECFYPDTIVVVDRDTGIAYSGITHEGSGCLQYDVAEMLGIDEYAASELWEEC